MLFLTTELAKKAEKTPGLQAGASWVETKGYIKGNEHVIVI